MDWIQVSIYTTTEGIEAVSGRLLGLGIYGIEIEDEQDFKQFLEENKNIWDYVDEELVKQKEGETCVKTYISANDPDTLAAINSSMLELKEYDTEGSFGRLEFELADIKEEDWSNNWKKYFHTMEIGDTLLVKPFWEEAPDTDRTIFEINPGLSFGTGSHHTTRLCLEDIEKSVHDGDEVLDLGCGSGILSIVSLMYGAKNALAVDIDPNSMDTAYDNLARNNISRDRYNVLIGNILTDEALQNQVLSKQYDIVLANIVADVIIAALPVVKRAIKPDGTFITSGIIEDRREDVISALAKSGFEIISEKRSADWAEFKCKLI